MSHINPAFDFEDAVYPEDDYTPEQLAERAENARDAKLDELAERAHALYIAETTINHATRSELEGLLNDIDPNQRLAIEALLEEAKRDEQDRIRAKFY